MESYEPRNAVEDRKHANGPDAASGERAHDGISGLSFLSKHEISGLFGLCVGNDAGLHQKLH